MIIEDCRQRNDWPKGKYAKKHNYICLLKEMFLDLYLMRLRVWNPLGTYEFLRKNKLKMMKLLQNTIGCSRFFTKTLYWFM